MKNYNKKLQYDINRKAGKISALISGKINKYKYITGKEILPSDQSRIMKQVRFTYSPLGKALEKQTKAIEDQRKLLADTFANQNKTLEALTNKDDHKIIH